MPARRSRRVVCSARVMAGRSLGWGFVAVDGLTSLSGDGMDGVPSGWWLAVDVRIADCGGEWSGRWVALGSAVGGVGFGILIDGFALTRGAGACTLVRTCISWEGLGRG